MFLKKANGYVVPVELFIKFHYSIDHQYIFLAIVKPFYEMTPFSNQLKYNINQLVFIITDNEDGRIFEYSESCREILKLSKRYVSDGIVKTIGDFIPDFRFDKFKQSRQQRYIENEIYEDIVKINISALSDISDI